MAAFFLEISSFLAFKVCLDVSFGWGTELRIWWPCQSYDFCEEGREKEGRQGGGQPHMSVASGTVCQEGEGRWWVSNLGKKGIATQQKYQLRGLWAGCLEASAKTRTDDGKRWIWAGLEKGRNREWVGEVEAGKVLVMRTKVSLRSWGQARDKKEGLRGW